MGWVSSLLSLGNSKTGRDLLNTKDGHLKNFGAALGNLKFTKEEMAEYDERLIEGIQKFAIDTMEENTERSATRRAIAISTIQFYLLTVFVGLMVFPFNPKWSEVILEVALDPFIAGMVAAVFAFFFGSHISRTTPLSFKSTKKEVN